MDRHRKPPELQHKDLDTNSSGRQVVCHHVCSACCPLQVLITVVHLTRDHVASDWFSIVLSVQCLLLWAKVQYFSR